MDRQEPQFWALETVQHLSEGRIALHATARIANRTLDVSVAVKAVRRTGCAAATPDWKNIAYAVFLISVVYGDPG